MMSQLRFAMMTLIAGVALIAQPSFGADTAAACFDKSLEKAPILSEGRVKPLFVHAKKFRKNVLQTVPVEGRAGACETMSDTALYCLLAQGKRATMASEYGCDVQLKTEHTRIKEILGLKSSESSATAEVVSKKHFELNNEYKILEDKNGLETGYGVALVKLLNGLQQLQQIEAGEDWKVLVAPGQWKPQKEAGPDFIAAVGSSSSYLTPGEQTSLSHEALYERLHLFGIAAGVCMVAFMLSLAGTKSERMHRFAMIGAGLLLLIEAGTMYLRVMVSGRAPVTNMFETVMWTAFGILTISVLMTARVKERKILTLGLTANMIALFMLNFATTMLDGTIRPLVPVLRDNFWLSTHVTTVTLAYAAYAMSWFAANFLLLYFIFRGDKKDLTERWNYISRIAMQVGSVLLAGGIILGGVWADYSWGRFWGWDPKETWSLIALMGYIVVLHGKYVGWFKGIHFAMAGAAAYLFVLMAWFGVNYILAAGLHSYGFSTGGAAFLASTFALQMLILGAAALRDSVNRRGGAKSIAKVVSVGGANGGAQA